MRTAVACALLGLAAEALACGYCVEDKVAAVYDHAVIMDALDRGHRVAFFAVEGPDTAAAERRALERSLAQAGGIDPGSLRVSLPSGALSFAYDPKRVGIGPVVGALERKLGPKGLSLSILRVIDRDDRLR